MPADFSNLFCVCLKGVGLLLWFRCEIGTRGEGVVLGVKCGENAAWKKFRHRLKIKSFSGRNEKFLGWFPPPKLAAKEKRITRSSQEALAYCLRPMLLEDFVAHEN